MRAVQFATVLDWQIEPATWVAVKAEASTLAKISIGRIRDEFMKIMLHPNRVRGLDLLYGSGLPTCILLTERNLLFAGGVIGGIGNGERGGLVPAHYPAQRQIHPLITPKSLVPTPPAGPMGHPEATLPHLMTSFPDTVGL